MEGSVGKVQFGSLFEVFSRIFFCLQMSMGGGWRKFLLFNTIDGGFIVCRQYAIRWGDIIKIIFVFSGFMVYWGGCGGGGGGFVVGVWVFSLVKAGFKGFEGQLFVFNVYLLCSGSYVQEGKGMELEGYICVEEFGVCFVGRNLDVVWRLGFFFFLEVRWEYL